MRRALLALALVLTAHAALALGLEEPLGDTAQEARARVLFSQLRCVVCQSESLADSPSDMAKAMRIAIREQVAAGQSDDAIRAELVARYGDFVLMKPPFKPSTALLWLGPLLVLLLAVALARRAFRKAGR